MQYLEEKQIDVSKVAGLGRDGAIVMVGRHNTVIIFIYLQAIILFQKK